MTDRKNCGQKPKEAKKQYWMEVVLPDGSRNRIDIHRGENSQFDQALGESYYENIAIKGGGSFTVGRLCPKEDLILESASERKGVFIDGHLPLKGSASFSINGAEECIVTPTQGYVFQYSKGHEKYYVPGGQEHVTLEFTLPEKTFRRFVGDPPPPGVKKLLAPESLHKAFPFPISNEVFTTIEKSIAPGLTGSLRRTQLEGAVLIFIAYMANALDRNYTERQQVLTDTELNAAQSAYDFLQQNISDPPTIDGLAESVNLSATRLNFAFRELYNGTVFEVLRNKRLEHSREMIMQGDLAIKEIAWKVGYNHVSNFTTAFTGQYGMSPAAYSKNLKI